MYEKVPETLSTKKGQYGLNRTALAANPIKNLIVPLQAEIDTIAEAVTFTTTSDNPRASGR
jgi:hypothetical protein